MWTGGVGRSSPMWTFTQKIKIRVHWRHPVFGSCGRMWTGEGVKNLIFYVRHTNSDILYLKASQMVSFSPSTRLYRWYGGQLKTHTTSPLPSSSVSWSIWAGWGKWRNARKFMRSDSFEQNNNVQRVVAVCLVPSLSPYRALRWAIGRVLCHFHPVTLQDTPMGH